MNNSRQGQTDGWGSVEVSQGPMRCYQATAAAPTLQKKETELQEKASAKETLSMFVCVGRTSNTVAFSPENVKNSVHYVWRCSIEEY